MITIFSININLVAEITIQQTYFLSFLIDKILKDFDNGVYTGMILIDLQEAFDMINHNILVEKLLPIGFSNNAIS